MGHVRSPGSVVFGLQWMDAWGVAVVALDVNCFVVTIALRLERRKPKMMLRLDCFSFRNSNFPWWIIIIARSCS